MNKPVIFSFFNNGNTAVFDKNGKQIPGLQESWLKLYAEFLEDKTGIKDFICEMPDRKIAYWNNGNWSIE
jgi:hypothetical protein